MPPLLYREPVSRPAFDAVILAAPAATDQKVLGLRASERARRVAERAGAGRVLVVTDDEPTAVPWWGAAAAGTALLVVDARGQLVHSPLIEPLLEGGATPAIAVDADGSPAGALLVDGDEAAQVAAAPAAALARYGDGRDATAVEHGAIARHPASTRDERHAAGRFLEQIVHKSQDGPVTRWLYRPVSVPVTRLLVRTPVTPNQISMVVAVLGAIGVYFTAQYEYTSVVIGSAIVLIAAYIDGCDGEVARLKLRTSKVGAWFDTITDEATTVAYLAALGYHNYLRHTEPWVAATLAISVAIYVISIYFVYYYLIVVHGSANSQDYVDVLEVVDGPTPGTRTLRPVEAEALTGVWAVLPHFIRRDFINWAALLLAAMHWTYISYGAMVVGGVTAIAKLGRDHVRLRKQLRDLRR